MWQHFISRETESSNVPVEIVGHFSRFFAKTQNFLKIHSKSISLNAEILRKSHTLSLSHGRLDLQNHPFFDTP
jgi:hypothetical protein